MPHLPGAARKITWDEVNSGFSEEQAVAEAKRRAAREHIPTSTASVDIKED